MKAANKKPVVVQGDHKVGYGRPPVDRRFKPGQSGNPRGTSRKLKHTPYEEQLKGIVTDELYRKIPVRDGDRTVRVPIMQAIIRSAAVSAAKGDVRAQRLVAELVRWTEEGRLASKLKGLEDAFDYKEGWSKELARRKRVGIVAEEPVPHPDHIKIDWDRAEIDIIGPMTPEQKKAIDEMRALKESYNEEIKWIQQELSETPGDSRLLSHLDRVKRALGKISSVIKD